MVDQDKGMGMGTGTNVKVVGSHFMEEEVATVLVEDPMYLSATLMETDTFIERMDKLLETGLVGLRLIKR